MTGSLQDRRVWIAGGSIAALLIVAASWFLLISPTLSSASDLRSQTADVQTQNDVQAAKNASLARQGKQLGLLRGKLQQALRSLPSAAELPEFTDEVTRLAASSGVRVQGVNVGSIAPVTGVASTTAPADSDSQDSASPSPATTPTTSTTTAATSAQYAISVTVTSVGAFGSQTRFVSALEHGDRRALINSTQLSGHTGGGTSVITQATIYSAPMSASQLADLKKILGTR